MIVSLCLLYNSFTHERLQCKKNNQNSDMFLHFLILFSVQNIFATELWSIKPFLFSKDPICINNIDNSA